MTMDNSKYLTIKVDMEAGKIIKIKDGKEREATRVEPEEIDAIMQSPNGFKYVGSIIHAHTNPYCIYVNLGGWWVKLCFGGPE